MADICERVLLTRTREMAETDAEEANVETIGGDDSSK